MADLRAAVVAEAERWIGTPYHDMAGVFGVGVDCVMLLTRVYQAVGLVRPEFDPRPRYRPQWFLHRGGERFVDGLLTMARRVDEPQPGDILLYRFGRAASHGALLSRPGEIIHAYRPARCVERLETRVLAARLDSCWSMI